MSNLQSMKKSAKVSLVTDSDHINHYTLHWVYYFEQYLHHAKHKYVISQKHKVVRKTETIPLGSAMFSINHYCLQVQESPVWKRRWSIFNAYVFSMQKFHKTSMTWSTTLRHYKKCFFPPFSGMLWIQIQNNCEMLQMELSYSFITHSLNPH